MYTTEREGLSLKKFDHIKRRGHRDFVKIVVVKSFIAESQRRKYVLRQ